MNVLLLPCTYIVYIIMFQIHYVWYDLNISFTNGSILKRIILKSYSGSIANAR